MKKLLLTSSILIIVGGCATQQVAPYQARHGITLTPDTPYEAARYKEEHGIALTPDETSVIAKVRADAREQDRLYEISEAKRQLDIAHGNAMQAAKEKAAKIASDHLATVRAMRDAGKKVSTRDMALVVKADADDAAALLAAQTAQAQAIIQQAQNALLRQQQEIAYQ